MGRPILLFEGFKANPLIHYHDAVDAQYGFTRASFLYT